MYRLIREILFRIDAEKTHEFATRRMIALHVVGVCTLLSRSR